MASFKMAGGGCCCCPEVLLLTDTTGSMGGFIATVKTVFNTLSQRIKDRVCKWSVCEYKDITDGAPYDNPGVKIDQKFTEDFALVTAGINNYSAGGGGDGPEEQFLALKYVAENWANVSVLGGTANKGKIIVWAGDAEAHSGGSYPVLGEVVTALINAKAKVFGINPTAAGTGIDTNNDASVICITTKGQLFNSVDFASVAAITSAIETAIG